MYTQTVSRCFIIQKEDDTELVLFSRFFVKSKPVSGYDMIYS